MARTSSAAAKLLDEVRTDADAAARRLRDADEDTTRTLAQAIERQLTTGALDDIERRLDLSMAQAAELFGISRQAYAKWHSRGVPADRQADVADVATMTEVLVTYVKVDRIAAVVRRPAEALDGETLLSRTRHDPAGARDAVREMFDLRRIQP